MMQPSGRTSSVNRTITDDHRTTVGIIATLNLQGQIDGLELQGRLGQLTVSGRIDLIDMITLRGQILGRIADYERADELAVQLVRDASADGRAFLARARTRATFHRFASALTDLDEAQRLGADPEAVDAERAAILQAIGRYDDALTLHRKAAERRADFASLGALALLHAERGEIAEAEQWFDESRQRHRGVSPFPLAMLDFQRGHMWMMHGDLHQARAWLDAAQRRLPAFAPAQGHLAQVEAALGESDAALARLLPLTTSSDDPEYAAQLARILGALGRGEEARESRAPAAAARYDELMARHPEAFADHAAEFWLAAGADPGRALDLARINLAVRPTPRARDLVRQASHALETAGLPGVSSQMNWQEAQL